MTSSTSQAIMKEEIGLKNKFCQLVLLSFSVKLFNAISSLGLFSFFFFHKQQTKQ